MNKWFAIHFETNEFKFERGKKWACWRLQLHFYISWHFIFVLLGAEPWIDTKSNNACSMLQIYYFFPNFDIILNAKYSCLNNGSVSKDESNGIMACCDVLPCLNISRLSRGIFERPLPVKYHALSSRRWWFLIHCDSCCSFRMGCAAL